MVLEIHTVPSQIAASGKSLAARRAVKRLRGRVSPALGLRSRGERPGGIGVLQESGTRVRLRCVAHVLVDARHLAHGGMRRVRENLVIPGFGNARLRLHFRRRSFQAMVRHELLVIELMSFCGNHSGRTFSVQNRCDVHDPTQR